MKHKAYKVLVFSAMIFLAASPRSLVAQSSAGGGLLKTVVIDPGHGGKDPGAPGPDSRNSEKHIVLSIAKHLGDKIKAEYPAVKVVYTRTGDTFPKLTDRIHTAKTNNADLFISIHCNSASSKNASGSSAHILARKDSRNPKRDLFEENQDLTNLENSVIEFEEDQSSYKDTAEEEIFNSLLFHANFEHSILFAQFVVENLTCKPFRKWGSGLHQNDFHLLKKMTCPAILVETAFLSNPEERKLLVSAQWQEEIADRLFKAFKDYKTLYDASVSSETAYVAPEPPKSAEQTATCPDESSAVPAKSCYSIQVMGLGRLLKAGDPALKGLRLNPVKEGKSNIYKYMYGEYGSYEAASKELPTVRKKFPEAFIVKVENEKVTRIK